MQKNIKPRHLVRVEDFTQNEYLEMCKMAKIFMEGGDFSYLCRGKVMASLFFQESTRTVSVFKAAMIRLGGGVIGIDGVQGTYLAKGEEDKEDTIFSYSQISDIVVIRDSDPNTLGIATRISVVPVINGGSGTEEHAAGGIGMAFAAFAQFGRLDGLKICIYGAPGPSRAAKAIVKFFGMFKNEIYEDIVMPELGLPSSVYDFVEKQGNKIQKAKLEDIIGDIDVLIVEGIPVKFVDPKLVDKYLSVFKPITMKEVSKMKENSTIHPITPRIIKGDLLSVPKEVDSDPRCGLNSFYKLWSYANMALIVKLLNLKV